MPDLRNVTIASVGVQTIGSLSLKDVLTTSGTPVRAWKQEIPRPKCWQASWDVAKDGNLLIVQQLLLGINAHVNYDLPQALLAVISDDDFADASLMARRRRDHERIDGVLAGRVAAEDAELAVHGRTLTDRVLQPLNRLSSHTTYSAPLPLGP